MMEVRSSTMKQKKENYRVAPSKLNIWLFMIASCMFFAAFVSAYIVQRPDSEQKMAWTVFDLPIFFLFSAITAVISSITIYMAWKSARQDDLVKNKSFLWATLLLGILFCTFQYLGWRQMVSVGLTLVNSRPEDISASYVWVITIFHALHVVGGLILLSVTLGRAYRFKVHKKEMTLMGVTHTYWHFVGLLWIYLYLFLYFAR